MKTLKELKAESKKFYTENASIFFAPSFSKKMGGTATITFEDDFLPTLKIDKREWYKGRGEKYNNASMHEHINVFVTKAEFNQKVENRAKSAYEREKEELAQKKSLNRFCKENNLTVKLYYSFSDSMGVFFYKKFKDEIEKELGVDLTDFFEASGKTYYFTESKIGRLEFYHNNHQSFSFNFVSKSRELEFHQERESWVSARYAGMLGNIHNPNLYVC